MAEKNKSNCPTVKELHDELKDLKKWETFGISLRCMEYPIIEEIKKDEHDTENQKLKLYAKWLNVCPDASWEDVIRALKRAEEFRLAKQVEEKKMDTGFYSLRYQYDRSTVENEFYYPVPIPQIDENPLLQRDVPQPESGSNREQHFHSHQEQYFHSDREQYFHSDREQYFHRDREQYFHSSRSRSARFDCVIQNAQQMTENERLITIMQDTMKINIKLTEEYKMATHTLKAQINESEFEHRIKDSENKKLMASLTAMIKRSQNLEQRVNHLEQQIERIQQEKKRLERINRESEQQLDRVKKELEESKRQVEQRNGDSGKELECDIKKLQESRVFQSNCFL